MERERYVIDSRLRPGRGSLPPEGPGSSALGRPQDPSSLPAGSRGAADRPRRGMRRRRAPADVHRLGGSGRGSVEARGLRRSSARPEPGRRAGPTGAGQGSAAHAGRPGHIAEEGPGPRLPPCATGVIGHRDAEPRSRSALWLRCFWGSWRGRGSGFAYACAGARRGAGASSGIASFCDVVSWYIMPKRSSGRKMQRWTSTARSAFTSPISLQTMAAEMPYVTNTAPISEELKMKKNFGKIAPSPPPSRKAIEIAESVWSPGRKYEGKSTDPRIAT